MQNLSRQHADFTLKVGERENMPVNNAGQQPAGISKETQGQLEKAFWLGYIYAALEGARLRLKPEQGPRPVHWTDQDDDYES